MKKDYFPDIDNISPSNPKLLKATAERVSNLLKAIAQDTNLTWDMELDTQISLLINRAEEVYSKAFVVIVVGPVKSGKSTFVNLLAHAHVSPTHFLECTVRPSIISQCKAGEKCCITTFRQVEDTKESPKADHVEAIIDYIKNLSYADLSGLDIQKYPLTKENLVEHVEQPIDSKVVRVATDNVLTSITAPGGDFLSKDIFIVDMPGFDGLRANLSDEAYSIIARRADLVIFIQSSNSAISKISADFFDILCKGNGFAPVCLIHNYFESAYWRTKEEQQRAIYGQMQKAKEIIKSRGFYLPDSNCFSINLGKVADNSEDAYERFVLPIYRPQLEEATQNFHNIEKELYQHIISSQQTTRLNNCLGRIKYEKEQLVNMINGKLREYDDTKQKYDNVKKELDAIREDHQIVYSNTAFPLNFSLYELAKNLDDIATVFMSKQLDMRVKYTGARARSIVKSMLELFAESIKMYFDQHIPITDYMLKINNITENRYYEINNTLSRVAGVTISPISDFDDDVLSTFDSSTILRAYDVEEKIASTHLVDRYKYESMRGMMIQATMTIIGFAQPSEPGIYCGGCLQTTILPNVKKDVTDFLQLIIRKRREAYSRLLEEKRNEVLAAIIPDFDKLDTRISTLKTLKTKLERIQFA